MLAGFIAPSKAAIHGGPGQVITAKTQRHTPNKPAHFRKRRRNKQLISITTLLLVIVLTTQATLATKCHLCLFQLARCTNPLDCYNQPDTCSNTNFSPVHSQTIDCEFGCEQYVITDATGSIVVWHRGCASEKSPKSSYICFSRNIYFLRHEQCWCHADYCNSSSKLAGMTTTNRLITFVISLLTTALLMVTVTM